MADNSKPLDPSDYRIGRVLFSRMWRLTKPYWSRKESWPSWIMMAMLLAVVGSAAFFSIRSSFAMKEMTDSLIAKDMEGFRHAMITYVIFGLSIGMTPAIMGLLDTRISVLWRDWLTAKLVDQYLSHRTYYDIALRGDLDNPDQRIQENIQPFIEIVTFFPRRVLSQIVTVFTGVMVLVSIDSSLIYAVGLFGCVQILITYLSYVPTIKQNFESQVAEADLRHGLLHVRENAEAVAFYQGEDAERSQILTRLKVAVQKQAKIGYYAYGVNYTLVAIFGLVWMLLPYLLLSPRVFSGELTFGAVTQGTQVATQVLAGVTALASFFPMITKAAPQAVRLAHIQERLEDLKSGRNRDAARSVTVAHNPHHVRMENISLETPGGEQKLIRDLSLTIKEGENLAIVGQTGVGKSSLLRAIAGLWTRGSGALEIPAPQDCLFLPQRPYMILSDLRSQLVYPHGTHITDEELTEILDTVRLPTLLSSHGGLDAVRDWGKVLSLGEQQRIAFARVLVHKPKFVFLDEATSAVDHVTEDHLYSELGKTGASYISIGHRLSILDHHTRILTIKTGGDWAVEDNDHSARESDAPAMATSIT